jgi:hypothetical protein
MRIRVTSKSVEMDVMRSDVVDILSGLRSYDDYILKGSLTQGYPGKTHLF